MLTQKPAVQQGPRAKCAAGFGAVPMRQPRKAKQCVCPKRHAKLDKASSNGAPKRVSPHAVHEEPKACNLNAVMLDLSPTDLVAIIAGPILVFILATAGWALRRTFAKQDEEMKKMATTQKEFDASLLKVLLAQSRFDERLEAGFDRLGSDMDSMKTSIAGLQSELRDHRATMDKEIAVIRERISRNGSP